MKKAYLIAVLSLPCLLGLGVSARAQDVDAVVVNVPFDFEAGGATLRAGEYRINPVNAGEHQELAIRSHDKGERFCCLWYSTELLLTSQGSASSMSEASTF
jgi:hypothetical protein